MADSDRRESVTLRPNERSTIPKCSISRTARSVRHRWISIRARRLSMCSFAPFDGLEKFFSYRSFPSIFKFAKQLFPHLQTKAPKIIHHIGLARGVSKGRARSPVT